MRRGDRSRFGLAGAARQDDATGGQGKEGKTVVATEHHESFSWRRLSKTGFVLIK
jgi:hypothetical protein